MIRRVALALVPVGGAAYCGALYVNDDLDELFPKALFKTRVEVKEKEKLVVLGSGWGSMSLLRKIDLDQYDLTLVSPRPYFFYTPLLAGSATGTVSQENICESVRKSLIRTDTGGDARYVQAHCTGVDLKTKTVSCRLSEGETMTLPYDKLVVAVGADHATYGIKGVKEHAYPLKEVEHAVAIRAKLLSLIERASTIKTLKGEAGNAEIDKLLHFVVVGGGPTGTELCGEMSDFINTDIKKAFPEIAGRIKITMLEGLPRILSMFDEKLAEYAKSHLLERKIDIRTNVFVTSVTPSMASLKMKSGETDSIEYGMLVWAAGITSRNLTKDLVKSIGAAKGQTSRRGLVVDEHLRVVGAEDVYAIGDCAVSGFPPTAQVASQQGKYLGRALNGVNTENEASVGFRYRDKGKMAYIGGGEGIVEVKLSNRPPRIDYDFWRSIHAREPRVTGTPGFVVWRSVYFSMLLSARNRVYIGMDWVRAFMFGRDITVSRPTDKK
mmetsp:Transcript_13106/g.19613  ORF Transcript_13106/g.19613 Transcript_13106/m.19613 type:complete len:495 (+) Transcript_13106:56-1540(+)